MVETGSAELAACNHHASDLVSLDATIAEMETAYENGDLDRLTRNDLAFHDIVLTASGNPFVPALMGQLGQLLYTLRRETSAFTEVQEHAIVHYKPVRAAIASRNPDEARRAMEEVPCLGTNHTAVRQLTQVVEDISENAVTPLISLTEKNDFGGFSPVGGALELSPLVQAQPDLAGVDETLARASADVAEIDTSNVLEQVRAATIQLS